MNKSRRDVLKRMSLAALAGFTPLYGFSDATKKRIVTGEDMYRGIFFAEGAFAQLIPEIQSLKMAYAPASLAGSQVETVRRQIIDHLRQSDTAFFTKFKAALMSHDVQCVERQLRSASERTAKTLDILYNSSTATNNGYRLRKKPMAPGQGEVLLVANAVACVNVIYILCSAAIFDQEEVVGTQQASPLLLEQMALSICAVAPTLA
ncbi:hypothetical protein [Spirosoma montaniterrae]|uniref:Uncharacterized protein n=1 Tax=Spirosoma montaniterrae TaxID=1178516 RepID=A0A1P9WZ59_9BACT|nr:hypothetical protein [Spirosoma montaniterrae]AQG80666.1 hypothetical protein AWR27_15830 [Spirosoma montaniterrae]